MGKSPKIENGYPDSAPKRGRTIDQAYQKIKEMLYNNQLVPGQRLIYRDLSERLGISITPIVQALNRLERVNIVAYAPNKGYFVGEVTESEARDCFEAREALETYNIPAVVENLTPADLRDIKNTWKKYGDSTRGSARRHLILLDAEFHLKIAEYSGNLIINGLLKQIFEQIYLKYKPEYLSDERITEVIDEHRSLLRALRKKDIEETRFTLEKHIRAGLMHVIQSLSRHTGSISMV